MPTETQETTVGSTSLRTAHFETAGATVNFRDSWRIFRIVTEVVEGHQFLSEIKHSVVVLGSARLPPNNKYYKIAVELGRLLGKNGFTTITGGGPGIMEAANRGAYEVGGESVGLNIQLPFEQRINPYVKRSIAFNYFFTRKVMLTSPANAFVFFPGGFGTLDEFFEVVDYMELGFMDRVPVVLVDRAFWDPILKFLREKSLKEIGSISEKDIANWHVVDTAEEAFELVKDSKDKVNVCTTDINNPLCREGTTDWRVFRIMSELVEGFEFLNNLRSNVAIFGGHSINPASEYYQSAYRMGKILAEARHTVVTGGGNGVIEGANRGAFEMGGESVGIGLKFFGKERLNAYLTKSTAFFYPFVRKLMMTAPSKAFVFYPGGFGTLHQLFEILTLQETQKMERLPILLHGREFWKPLISFIHELNVTFKTISQVDETFLEFIDIPEDVLQYVGQKQ